MHITITIMTGLKNHRMLCKIHGGNFSISSLGIQIWHLKGKQTKVDKTCFLTLCFYNFHYYYHLNHLELKTPYIILHNFFFPKKGANLRLQIVHCVQSRSEFIRICVDSSKQIRSSKLLYKRTAS